MRQNVANEEDVAYRVSGNRAALLALRRKVERGAPGQFTMLLRERKAAARDPLGHTEITDLIISAVAGGVAKATVDYLLALLKDAGKKGSIRAARKRGKKEPSKKKAATKKAAKKKPAKRPVGARKRNTRG
ncbi:MAG: hypothetical protein U0R19_21345 [Bryobacteraceae bacterium]